MTKYKLLEFETNIVAKAILHTQETLPTLREVRCSRLSLAQVLNAMASALHRVNDCTQLEWDLSDFECGREELDTIMAAVQEERANGAKQLQKVILDEAEETMDAARQSLREYGIELAGPT